MPLYPEPTDGYVVSVKEVATLLGAATSALTELQVERIELGIAHAQGRVEDALHRPLLPVRSTRVGLVPGHGQDPMTWQAWRGAWGDNITVVSAVEQPDQTWTVTVDVGLDARTIPGIREFIAVHAAEAIRDDPDSDLGRRNATSLSAEGQSVSYAGGSSGRGYAQPARTAGSLPRLEDLQRRWAKPLIERVGPGAQAAWPEVGPYVDRSWR